MLKPFQKSHNTAFRLFTALLYGLESNLPYLSLLGQEGRQRRLSVRSTACAYSMRMTLPRFKEHLAWLEQIGLLSDQDWTERGTVKLTIKLPE